MTMSNTSIIRPVSLLANDRISLRFLIFLSTDYSLQLLLHLDLCEGLDDITNLDVVEVNQRDTTLQACCHFLGIVLVAL